MLERIEEKIGSEWRHDSFIFLLKILQRYPNLLELVRRRYSENPNGPEVSILGIKFPNPVGLAAGLDKNAEVVQALSAFGFGHIEVGTVTPLPQEGNPKPRVWRVPKEQSVVNWLGFPNAGMEHIAKNLSRVDKNLVIGINVGKNADTPLEDAAEDYVRVLEGLAPFASYFVLNTSSPNTPGLRQLNQPRYLSDLLQEVNRERNRLTGRGLDRPILLKLSPDHSEAGYLEILKVAQEFKVDGIIATNTTTSRNGLEPNFGGLPGGLSGRLLADRSLQVLRFLVRETNGKMPIISVGGIMGPDDARIRFDEGAVLVQVLTGFTYDRGIAKKIVGSIEK